jgi:D-hexose-6-phosphate mutarotase
MEGIQSRQRTFEARIEVTSALCEYFHTSIDDIEKLSIEEFDKLFEIRERRVKEHNERLKSRR